MMRVVNEEKIEADALPELDFGSFVTQDLSDRESCVFTDEEGDESLLDLRVDDLALSTPGYFKSTSRTPPVLYPSRASTYGSLSQSPSLDSISDAVVPILSDSRTSKHENLEKVRPDLPYIIDPSHKAEGLRRGETVEQFIEQFNGSKDHVQRALALMDNYMCLLFTSRDGQPQSTINAKRVQEVRSALCKLAGIVDTKGAERSHKTMNGCDDITVKEQALFRLIFISERITYYGNEHLLEAKVGEGLLPMIEKLIVTIQEGDYVNNPLLRGQRLWMRTLATALESFRVLYDNKKVNGITEEVKGALLTTITHAREMNTQADREIEFFAVCADEIVRSLPTEHKIADDVKKKALSSASTAINSAVTGLTMVAEASGNVASGNYVGAVAQAISGVTAITKDVVSEAQGVFDRIHFTDKWVMSLLTLKRLCGQSIDTFDDFNGIVEVVQKHMKFEDTPIELSYGIVTILEYTVLNSNSAPVREAAMKLLFQYSNIDGEIVKSRVVDAFLKILNLDKSEDFKNTSYAILTYFMKIDRISFAQAEKIEAAFEKKKEYIDAIKKTIAESRPGKEKLCMDVMRFIITWDAGITDTNEPGGSSLITLVAQSRKNNASAVLLSWIAELFPERCAEPDVFGNTGLHIAAMNFNGPMFHALLKALPRIDINACDFCEGLAALHYAVKTASREMVQLIFAAGADQKKEVNKDVADKEGNTPLHYAVRSIIEREKTIKGEAAARTLFIEEHVRKMLIREKYRTLLRDLCRRGDITLKVRNELLKNGAIDAMKTQITGVQGGEQSCADAERDVEGKVAECIRPSNTPHWQIARLDKNTQRHIVKSRREEERLQAERLRLIDITDNLIKQGANVNALNKNGKTLLDRAIEDDNVELVKLLKVNGARVSSEIRYNTTDISIAARTGKLRVLTYLIERRIEEKKNIESTERVQALTDFEALDIVHSVLSRENIDRCREATDGSYDMLKDFAWFHILSVKNSIPYYNSFQFCRLDDTTILENVKQQRIANNPEAANIGIALLNIMGQGRSQEEKVKGPRLIQLAYNDSDVDKLSQAIDQDGVDESNCFGLHPLHSAVIGGAHENLTKLCSESAKTKGADVNATTIEKYTPLHLAAIKRDFVSMETLIDAGANPSAQTIYGDTPLSLFLGVLPDRISYLQHMMPKKFSLKQAEGYPDGSVEKLETMLMQGDFIPVSDKTGDSILHRVVHDSSTEIVALVCKKIPTLFWEKNDRGLDPLHDLLHVMHTDGNCRDDAKQIVDTLIRTYVKEKHEGSFLAFAKEFNEHTGNNFGNMLAREDLADLFKEYYAQESRSGGSLQNSMAYQQENRLHQLTPLHVAARHNSQGILKVYTEHGLDLNHPDRYNNTALHQAVLKGYDDFLGKLIAAGASVNARNRDGRPPLHIAAAKGNAAACRMLIAATKEDVTAQDVDVTAQDVYDNTALQMACIYNRVSCVELLLEASPESYFTANSKMLPIHTAVIHGSVDVFRYLVCDEVVSRVQKGRARKVDIINEKDVSGRSLPILACSIGGLEMLKLCVERDADITATDFLGESCFHKAIHALDIDIVRYLVDLGSKMIFGPDEDFRVRGDADGETPLHEMPQRGGKAEEITEELREAAYAIFNVLRAMKDLDIADIHDKRLIHKVSEFGAAYLFDNVMKATQWTHAPRLVNGVITKIPLLRAAALARLTSSEGDTPVHRAAAEGQIAVIEKFISPRPDTINPFRLVDHSIWKKINHDVLLARKNKRHNTPFLEALSRGHYDVASVIAKNNHRVLGDHQGFRHKVGKIQFRKNKEGNLKRNAAALLCAKDILEEKDVKALTWLLEKRPRLARESDDEGNTLLHLLAKNSRNEEALDIVRAHISGTLSKKCEFVRKTNKAGKTAAAVAEGERDLSFKMKLMNSRIWWEKRSSGGR